MSKEQKDKVVTYFCVWDEKKACKIRTQYKLQPESLILFCAQCMELPLNRAKIRINSSNSFY